MRRRAVRLLVPVAALAALSTAPLALAAGGAAPSPGVQAQCFAPPSHVDPQPNASGVPTNPQWILRDQTNQY